MRSFKKYLFILQAVISFNLIFIPCKGENLINLGELSRIDEEQQVSISVTSANVPISTLMVRAFTYHGAFEINAKGNGDYFLQINQTGTNSVKLFIEKGHPKELVYEEEIIGKSLDEAVFKACDKAVEKILAIPGFFAGKLVFVGEREGVRELFISDLFFKNVQQLTHDKADVLSPRWDPKGEKIAYTSYCKNGFPDVFVIDRKKGTRKVIASYEGLNTGGAFDPTGRKVALILSSNGNAELFIAEHTGKNPQRLTHSKALEAAPSWYPDGNRICFVSDQLGSPQLYTFNLKNKTASRICTNISGYCSEPKVNPINSDLIAFTAATAGTFQIALYDKATGKSHFLTSGKADYIEPTWASDGRHLIITKRIKKQQTLYLLDTVSKNKTPLHSEKFGFASMSDFVLCRT